MRVRLALPLVGVLIGVRFAEARPTLDLVPIADAVLYQDDFGFTANSLGQYIFAGETAFGFLRRSLLKFDLSSIPSSATINSVSLRLHLSRAISGDLPVTLHRCTSAWNEGPSVGAGQEGAGSHAEPGDPTWIHSSFDTVPWMNAGGDYDPTISATQFVGFMPGFIVWSDSGLVADAQSWVGGAQPNHGWMLIGTEGSEATAKRFDSKDNVEPSFRPLLTIVYTVPPPECPGDANGDLVVNFADITFILANFNNPFTFSHITLALANFNNDCQP